MYLASRLGLFAPQDVSVELADFTGASKGMEALIGGSIDILSGYYTQALQVRAQGREVDVFLSVYDSNLIALAVAPSARERVRTLADLKGTKIGVTTLGSATHQFADFIVRRAGLPADAVTPIAIGTAARAVAAMERGVVDTGVVTDFTIQYLQKRHGSLTLLADTRTREGVAALHGVDAFPGTVLMAQRSWVKAHAAAARAVSRAVWQAVEWMKAHTPEEVVARMPEDHYGGDREAYLAANTGAIPLLSRTGRVDPPGHRAACEFLALPQTTASAFREPVE